MRDRICRQTETAASGCRSTKRCRFWATRPVSNRLIAGRARPAPLPAAKYFGDTREQHRPLGKKTRSEDRNPGDSNAASRSKRQH
eukprot:6190063-Pleurochrysis_carterae.AAC.3